MKQTLLGYALVGYGCLLLFLAVATDVLTPGNASVTLVTLFTVVPFFLPWRRRKGFLLLLPTLLLPLYGSGLALQRLQEIYLLDGSIKSLPLYFHLGFLQMHLVLLGTLLLLSYVLAQAAIRVDARFTYRRTSPSA